MITFFIWLFSVTITVLLCVPDWKIYNRNPIKWKNHIGNEPRKGKKVGPPRNKDGESEGTKKKSESEGTKKKSKKGRGDGGGVEMGALRKQKETLSS